MKVLIGLMMCVAVLISGCDGNYMDKVISPQITAAVGPDPIITTVSRSVPIVSDTAIYFASRGGAELIGAREIVIYDPVAVTGDFGGIIGDRMAWAVFMEAKDNNLIITIPSDADHHVCIDGQCIAIEKEIK